ncbi:MAG TPA: YceI family protein [Dinghuibacter sp.]|uniref:YceI family protein n=1 Tax=Dinghuibacter sp. TaxID=2024697 RepID=UPI002BE179E9|nr:YceI family protein [Dinghuibacter sp.]HTJ11768.1 YceI family protein [Dinghuibacter sp.]
MNTLLFLLCATLVASASEPVDQGSSITFTIANFGIDVTGSFSGLQGAIHFDPASTQTASFDVSIDAASVHTGNSLRDSHLKGEDYFDVQHWPRIRLVSTSVTRSGDGFVFNGKLSIKNHTMDVRFPFTATSDARGTLFTGSFKINRRDFGIGGFGTIANELSVTLKVEAV